MTRLHFLLPARYDDPANPSGGNDFDRRVIDGLRSLGWQVTVTPIEGPWPHGDPDAQERLTACLAAVPDGGTVLVDGLIASLLPEVLAPAARRLRLVVLSHLAFGLAGGTAADREAERASLRAADLVVTTSAHSRERLLTAYEIAPSRVRVATPGVDEAQPVRVSPPGSRLLCVGAMTPVKGQDLLLEALSAVRPDHWHCTFVGPLDRDPACAAEIAARAGAAGISDRVTFTGALAGARLDAAFASADVLLVPSRYETFGMVVLEALARGLPVIASDVGGLPEALGTTDDAQRPGLLVGGGSPQDWQAALESWLGDEHLRDRLRAAALLRRPSLPRWETTARAVADALSQVSGQER